MVNRTIYDVLDKVMEDYSYSIKKTGNKIELNGEVYIPRLDRIVAHTKIVYCANGNLQETVGNFRDELKNMVVKVLKENKLVLTDDDEMIKSLMDQCKELREELENAREREKELKERVNELEMEKMAYPYYPSTYPMRPGVTYGPDRTETPPNEWYYRITCDEANTNISRDPNCDYSTYSTSEGTELPEGSPRFRINDGLDKLR